MKCARQIVSGEMHYARIPAEYWSARLRMAQAMGLDAISTYVFWNRHEPEPDRYDFEGQNDVAAYIRLAHEAGLDVILRPGPYVCAEWDFGGLPAWLLRDGALHVRTLDDRFMAYVRGWLRRLGSELAPLLHANGGPIVAVQLENEYGAYGSDAQYLKALKNILKDSGFSQTPLYTIDQPADLASGSLPGIPMATTFAPGDPASHFTRLRELRPDAPLLCGEYWAGWFDHWGETHAKLDDAQQNADLDWMLAQGASVNIYMLHGGTNFGFWNGANSGDGKPYQPTTTSYDYCAAIDEAGRPTEKYYAFRNTIARVMARAPRAVPDAPPCTSIPEFQLKECARFDDMLPAPVSSRRPLPMEAIGQSLGFVLYRTKLRGPFSGELTVDGVRDYAVVCVDGRPVARLDRRSGESAAFITSECDAILEILVENCGRINYGPDLPFERKGITGSVRLGRDELFDWDIYALPMDDLGALRFENAACIAPCFYRGRFTVDEPADTFLDMRDAGKGVVWVNGRNAGRYWNIGPQHSLYVPAPWLSPGLNEVIVFELLDRKAAPRLRGSAQAIFDR